MNSDIKEEKTFVYQRSFQQACMNKLPTKRKCSYGKNGVISEAKWKNKYLTFLLFIYSAKRTLKCPPVRQPPEALLGMRNFIWPFLFLHYVQLYTILTSTSVFLL